MERTYIQVKKLNDLLGDMTNCKVEVHIYKRLSYNFDDCIFTAVVYSKDLPIVFGDYWAYTITTTVADGCGAIKMLICIDRPNEEWHEV